MALNLVSDITNALKAEIAAELGPSYRELDYVNDVQKNSFRSGNERYGVRALSGSQIPGVTKNVTLTQNFEIVLTKQYLESNINDEKQVQTSLENSENMLDIYKRVVNNRGGLPGTILNIFNLEIGDPEYLLEDKVSILRANITVTYRFSLI